MRNAGTATSLLSLIVAGTVAAAAIPIGCRASTLTAAQGSSVSTGAPSPDAIVRVSGGRIRGARLDNGGAVFKGIPYAQPPVGGLRWREPMPVKPWVGIRGAKEFGQPCAQTAAGPMAPAPNSSEDCLYLNVLTPDWPGKSPKPVMVWVPGGGNFQGGITATGPDSDAESLARHGVVVVSLNYRLGTFGFFSHPALTRESPHHASGNQGILDQIAALKWVRANIARFGGDPRNVTIFGESAGAHDVSVLMTTPLSQGLFKRVIAESGSVVLGDEPQTLRDAERRGQALAARWQVPPSASPRDLRAVPAAAILKAEPDYFSNPPGPNFPNLGIVVDGYVFPRSPISVFAEGKERRAPLLHGSNARDGIPSPGYMGPEDLPAAIDTTYGPLGARAKDLYQTADPLYGTPTNQWAEDMSFRCPAVAQLVWHARAGNPSFHYEFAHSPSWPAGIVAPHAQDVAYVFGVDHGVAVVPIGTVVQATPQDRQVSETMQAYWTNFAKTGDPNGSQLPKWPRFDASRRAYIRITAAGPVAGEGLRRAQCELFMQNLKRVMAN
jgi:para-nitrobenzyl esterase